MPGLAVELPLTTTVMLHSIVEIARANGEDMSNPESALACLQVLALGPEGQGHEAMESAYYATRAALAQVTPGCRGLCGAEGDGEERGHRLWCLLLGKLRLGLALR